MNNKKTRPILDRIPLTDTNGNAISSETNLAVKPVEDVPHTIDFVDKGKGKFKLIITASKSIPLNDKIYAVAVPSALFRNKGIHIPETARGGLRYFVVAVAKNTPEPIKPGDEIMPFSPYGPINSRTGESDAIVIQFPDFIETRYKESGYPYQHTYYVLYYGEMAGYTPKKDHGIEIEFIK